MKYLNKNLNLMHDILSNGRTDQKTAPFLIESRYCNELHNNYTLFIISTIFLYFLFCLQYFSFFLFFPISFYSVNPTHFKNYLVVSSVSVTWFSFIYIEQLPKVKYILQYSNYESSLQANKCKQLFPYHKTFPVSKFHNV